MKKIIIAALAATFMAAPVVTATQAGAQSRQELREDRRELRQDRREIRRDRRELRRDVRQHRREANRPSWLRQGQRFQGYGANVDYRRYGLRAPGRGERWIRYNDVYVLISTGNGVIIAVN